MLFQADAVDVWTGPEGDDGTSELDTGQLQLLQHKTSPEP